MSETGVSGGRGSEQQVSFSNVGSGSNQASYAGVASSQGQQVHLQVPQNRGPGGPAAGGGRNDRRRSLSPSVKRFRNEDSSVTEVSQPQSGQKNARKAVLL